MSPSLGLFLVVFWFPVGKIGVFFVQYVVAWGVWVVNLAHGLALAIGLVLRGPGWVPASFSLRGSVARAISLEWCLEEDYSYFDVFGSVWEASYFVVGF
jgi:hypothetical protein